MCVCVCKTGDVACIGKCQEKGMAEQLCGNYTTITDRQGRNALKGAIAFEGYAEGKFAIHSLYFSPSHPNPCISHHPTLTSVLTLFEHSQNTTT